MPQEYNRIVVVKMRLEEDQTSQLYRNSVSHSAVALAIALVKLSQMLLVD